MPCQSVLEYFIDGTVAGTDVSVYRDGNINHDHTYFGNSCSIAERGGADSEHKMSQTSCSTRIISTTQSGSDPQYIGVYYNYFAATTGSGGTTLSTDNTNAPDSFCPLGWQLPYSGTGGDYYDKSKSWNYLNSAYPSTHRRKNYPISLIFSGHFNWDNGSAGTGLFWLEVNGYIWSSTIYSVNQAYWADINGGAFDILVNKPGKTNGPTLRCVKFLVSFSRFA